MKNSNPIISYVLCVLVLISSCTMQKRHYMSGYDVAWKKKVLKEHQRELVNEHKKPITKSECRYPQTLTAKAPKAPEANQDNAERHLTASVDKVFPASPSHRPHLKQNDHIHFRVNEKDGGSTETTGEDSLSSNAAPQTHWGAIAGLSCGVIGIFAFGITSPLAIICSSIALSKIKNNKESYKGRKMAKAGLILGIIFSILWLMIYIAAGNFMTMSSV